MSLVQNGWRVNVLTYRLEDVLADRETLACRNFFVSLEDDVIKKYGPSWVHKMYKDYTVNKQISPELLEGRRYRKLVEKAQKASDSAARSSRRQTLEYAESMNIQREMVYSQRNRLIDGTEDLDGFVVDMLDEFVRKSLSEEPL